MAPLGWTDSAMTWLAAPGRAQLALTAALSGTLVAGTILTLQTLRRDKEMSDLKSSIPRSAQQDPIANKITQYGDPRNRPLLASNPTSTATTIEPISKDDARSAALAERARKGDYDEDLILEQLARNRVFLTDPGLSALRSSFVIVVGCGGVGSHAVAALARSGVGKIRLIDFDQVTLSSLNRHAVATLADVGTPKVQCIRTRLEQIAPWIQFDCRNELFTGETAARHLEPWQSPAPPQPPDYVIDAIDNIDSKVALLAYCHANSLPCIASMGAGCKSDPTRVFTADISASTEDPLSRATRRRLRMLGIASGIPCVFSTEKPGPGKAALLPLPDDEFAKGKVGELGVLPDFRVRILPVLGTMPAVFGLCVANFVLLKVAGYPSEPVLVKQREKMYEALLAGLQGCEERLVRGCAAAAAAAGGAGAGGEVSAVGLKLPLSTDDVAYLLEEVYRGKSVVSGLSTRMAIVRWRFPPSSESSPPPNLLDLSTPNQKLSTLTLRDLVLMTKEEAVKHEKEVLKQGGGSVEDVWGGEVVRRVEARMEEERGFSVFR